MATRSRCDAGRGGLQTADGGIRRITGFALIRPTSCYAFGDTITKRQAQFSEENWGSAGKTLAVGSFQPNAFGLYDMHGNVWEWVQDCWNASYSRALSDGSALTAGDCIRQIVRGGSWVNLPQILRSATRNGYSPGNRYNSIGFRVAGTL